MEKRLGTAYLGLMIAAHERARVRQPAGRRPLGSSSHSRTTSPPALRSKTQSAPTVALLP